MFQPKTIARQAEPVSTKWHSMKARFRYLFKNEHHANIEAWYNTIALHKQRDMFREIVKALHQHEPSNDKAGTVEAHRANHMMTMYGVLLTPDGQAKTRSWLTIADAKQLDKFREVFAAVQSTLQPVSATKTQFQYRPPSEEVNKFAHRKKIDWESSRTAEHIRETHKNPMDTHSHLPTAGVGGAAPKKFIDRGTAAAQSIMKILKVTDEDLEVMRKERAQEHDNFYEVEPSGTTVFKTKAARGSQTLPVPRVINTFSGNSASDWRTTNRESHRNPGPVKVERVVAEEHPAIAQVTASLGFCLPNLSPKKKDFTPSRGSPMR